MRLYDAEGLVELRSNDVMTCINMAWTVRYQIYWVSFSNDAAHLPLLWLPTALKVWPLKENTQTGVADVCFSLFFVCLKKKLFGLEIIDKKIHTHTKKNSWKKRLVDQKRIQNARQVEAKLFVEFCWGANAARWQHAGAKRLTKRLVPNWYAVFGADADVRG